MLPEKTSESTPFVKPILLRRGPVLILALLAAMGGAAIYIFALPALWRIAWPYGLLFTVLGAAQLGTAVAVLIRPARGRVLL
ncbi:MAG TPA: hypothetical protein VF823_03160, partial [Anaerolineales bacterium]